MKKFLRKNKKYIGLVLITVITFNFLFLPLITLAQQTPAKNESSFVGSIITWFTAKPILFASSLISMLLSAVFGVILYLEAQIIDYILSPTNFSFTNSPIVTLGWGITRDLANMFFIVILLIIAFATVLKIQSYAIKQLWWKVVVAALLINFSLVIAGFVIDFTQILTTFFIKQAIGDSFLTITTKLMSSMQITNFYNPSLPTSVIQGITDIGPAAVAALVGIVLTLIGLVVTVFVFGAAAIFLIVRILYLWLLLIFAPIVWMLWILPATSGHFSQWWHSFIKWAFFAPIFAFMIYLSLSIFDATGQLNPKVFGVFPALWKTAAPGLTTISMPAAIFQWILVIAMMFGSLIVAQKFGVHGAAASQKILKGWGNRAKGFAARELRKRGVGWTQPLPEGVPPPTGVRGLIRRAGAGLGRAAVAVPGARGAYLGLQAVTKKDYENAQNKYKDIDPVVLEQMAQSKIMESRDKLAIQQILMEKKKFKPNAEQLMPILDQAKRYNKEEEFLKIVADKMGDSLIENNGYTTKQREELVRRAKNNNIDKEFSKLFPAIAARVLGKSIEDIVSKIEKVTDILEDQLTAEVIKAFSSDQLKSLAKSPDVGKRTKISGAVLSDFRALPQQTQQNIRKVITIPDKNKRESARNLLNSELRVLSRKYEMITTPGFEL